MPDWVLLLLSGGISGAVVAALMETRCRRSLRGLERTHAELEDTRRLADEASEAKSRILSNMGHELRTPLNAIIGYAFLLREQALERGADSMVPDLEQIQNAGEHLIDLINDVLDLSGIETGHIELRRTSFDVATLVEAVAHAVRPQVAKNGNTLRVEVAAGVGTMVSDETRLRQVLVNLLSNAAKFTEDGAVELVVTPAETDERACVVFRVSDTGVGMTADQVRQAFDTFWQADQSITRRHEGAGLGLGLARTLCTMMGGTLDAESTPGAGTTFTATLPAAIGKRDSGHWRAADRARPEAG